MVIMLGIYWRLLEGKKRTEEVERNALRIRQKPMRIRKKILTPAKEGGGVRERGRSIGQSSEGRHSAYWINRTPGTNG